MNLRKQANDTLTEVSDATKKVVETANWSTVALIAVAAVSILALGIGIRALTKVSGNA